MPEKVDVARNGVNHVFDVVLAQSYLIHANIDVRIGRLNDIFANPEQHRLQHSTDRSEAGHHGS